MIIRRRVRNPRVLMSIGMMCLVVAILLGFVGAPTGALPNDFAHGVRGMLFGISIAAILLSVRRTARQRRSSGDASTDVC